MTKVLVVCQTTPSLSLACRTNAGKVGTMQCVLDHSLNLLFGLYAVEESSMQAAVN